MTDSIKMAKLDWLTVKGYAKQMLFSYLIVTVVLLTTQPLALNIIYFILINSFLMYPFMIEEQHGMNRFYAMIATTKKARIGARYLEIIICLVVTTGMLIVINSISPLFAQEEMPFALLVAMWAVGVFFFSLLIAIEMPCCFRWGYSATKMVITLLPVGIGLGVPAAAFLLTRFIPKEAVDGFFEQLEMQLTTHVGIILIGTLLFACISLFISYKVSLNVCKKG